MQEHVLRQRSSVEGLRALSQAFDRGIQALHRLIKNQCEKGIYQVLILPSLVQTGSRLRPSQAERGKYGVSE